MESTKLACDLIGIDETIIFKKYKTDKTELALDYKQKFHPKKREMYVCEPYSQVFMEKNKFQNDLSILDLLFNLGPETMSYLQKQVII